MSDASLSPLNSSISSCSSPSEAASPRPLVAPEDLPLPTAPRPFPTKKSHARKQPLGHIPRPRNAFILFRCDYGRQNQRTTQERDQNDVSRMVGTLWRNMTDAQRAPWVVMAEAEKKKHAALYPGYKYTPRNRKARLAEKGVKRQIEKEGEKAVEAELAAENSKDMVTVYYPPWATRRTLTYFARRATSCPPPGSISIEPYSETLDRAMVTTNPLPEPKAEQVSPPSSPAADECLASVYGIHDGDHSCSSDAVASGAISADHMLSQGAYRIDPPGGTSWGSEDPPSPSRYPRTAREAERHGAENLAQNAFLPSTYAVYAGNYARSLPWAVGANHSLSHSWPTIDTPGGTSSWDEASVSPYEYPQSPSTEYTFRPAQASLPPLFYTTNGEYAMPGYSSYAGSSPSNPYQSERYYDNWWAQETPALQASSPSDASSPPSPITPTDDVTPPGSPSGASPSGKFASFPSAQEQSQDDFRSEFGIMFQSRSAGYESSGIYGYGAGVSIVARESSVRTTYTPNYDGLGTSL